MTVLSVYTAIIKKILKINDFTFTDLVQNQDAVAAFVKDSTTLPAVLQYGVFIEQSAKPAKGTPERLACDLADNRGLMTQLELKKEDFQNSDGSLDEAGLKKAIRARWCVHHPDKNDNKDSDKAREVRDAAQQVLALIGQKGDFSRYNQALAAYRKRRPAKS